MALVLKDRVQETSTTTGTGTLTLAGAVTQFQTFSAAVGNGNTTYYTIYNAGGSQWEVGLGTVGAGTLARTTVLASSNAGAAVNFTGTLYVFGDYPAGKAVYQDANGEITGTTINANTKFVAPDYYAQSILGGNLRTYTGTALVNWDGGGSGNVTFNGGISANPANKNISLSPTGTGSVTINPATAGSMNNVVIGATTPLAITGTTITATTFSGSGASLTSIPNSALVNSAITINGTSTSLGGSISVGSVTAVSATAPITSSGGATPDIAMPAATGSVNGYLTSTDWTTFNGKGSGTVTSVAATVPSFLSVTGSPITSSGTLAIALSGTALPAANGGTGLTSPGTNGNVLTSNGTAWVSSAPAGGSLTWQSVQTANFTIAVGNGYPVNTTSAAITVTLPASPTAGQQFALIDYAGTWATNNLTIDTSSSKINGVGGAGTTLKLNTNRLSVNFVYIDATQGWLATINNNNSFLPASNISVDYLVIAGGAGGGFAGGGAGGYREGSSFGVTAGTTYTITVGGGGATVTGISTLGNAGSDSVFSSITSTGGGGGGAFGTSTSVYNGGNGGSGGGAGAQNNAPTYTAGSPGAGNTPSTSPSQGNNGGNGQNGAATCGGGGGAGAVGGNSSGVPSTEVGGAGGAGSASSITGTAVTRGGGGGGAGRGTGGAAGTGGGGAGGSLFGGSTNGTSGTANTGGGGGGNYNGTSGAGGTGVVIISSVTAAASTTGSPTVTTSGGRNIYQFDSSGSITF